MPGKSLKYNHWKKLGIPFISYDDSESILEKKNKCHSNPEKLPTAKINKHTTFGCSLFTHCLFDATKNNPEYYKDCKDCMKRISKDLKKHATKIINYEKNKK